MSTLKLSVSDPEFVDKIIFEVKSQGHFDMFRKECLADVDTQPAYQNLHSRVEDSVQKFLNRQVWTPETNKNRLREEMRHNIIRAGYLDSGVSRIVDQIVEQKMDYIQSKVEAILYDYVGIEKQQSVKKENGALEVDTTTTDLLPTDLEQVSPDSDKKSQEGNEEIEEEVVDDFESPAFEPIGVEAVTVEKPEETQNSNLSEISGLTSQDSPTEKNQSEEKDETMLSQISSNEKSSTFVNTTDNNEMTGEEAQMPPEITDESMPVVVKEPEPMVIESPKFDLNRDSIEFTGTERKNILSDESTNSNDDKTQVLAQPLPIANDALSKAAQMEVDNLDDNDTTDSSEVRMEIDLKDETTQESSKVEDNSQDSSQKLREKDKDSRHHSSKSHKRDKSKDRHKSSSSSHKSSSSHRHHSKSSSSRHESSSSKRSGKSSSSSSHKKSSVNSTSDREKDKDKEKDRTSSSGGSSSHKKSKHRDDHHSSSSSKSRRKSIEHESATADEKAKTDNEQQRCADDTTKAEKSESSACDGKKKSSILMKYDYLKADSTNETQQKSQDEADDDDFLGFERASNSSEEQAANPWMEFFLQTESERNRSKTDAAAATHTTAKAKVTRKSKSPDSVDSELAHEAKIQQQRYDTQDLYPVYKPRFDFSNRQRRRGQNVEETATTTTTNE